MGESGQWREEYIEICFRVQTKKILNVDRINAGLRQFREFLKGFKIKQDLLLIHVEIISDFHWKKLDGNTLICSNKLRLGIIDDRQNWAQEANTTIRPLIYKKFGALKFDTVIWEENFAVDVVDVIFDGEKKSSNWPSDEHIALAIEPVDYVGDLAQIEHDRH